MINISSFFHLDALAFIMIALVGYLGLNVGVFASRYMRGDANQRPFLIRLLLLVFSVSVMVSADHLLLLLFAWGVSNYMLVKLMIHKDGWQAAKESGKLAARVFKIGFAALSIAFLGIYAVTGETSIQAMLQQESLSPVLALSLAFIIIAAVTQSALFPFHTWLLSSLNSPTPVSAIMHAGLVNGGGFLLVRFAPLYFEAGELLSVLFILGITSALLGTLFKLMQSDVKRMLACSTMGQMGFMVAQCGMGLFPAAVAHLCWHGMFKAYLFLASGSAAQEKRFDLQYPPSLLSFGLSLICGAVAAYGFAFASGKTIGVMDTTALLVLIALIAGSQFALPMLRQRPLMMLLPALVLSGGAGAVYGLSVMLIGWWLAPYELSQPQPLNAVYVAGATVLVISWLAILFGRNTGRETISQFRLRYYMTLLNASQPHPATVTAHRNHYKI